MPSILLLFLVFQSVVYIINSIGSSAFNELLWHLYTKLPTSTAKSAQAANKLKYEVLRLKKEMSGVSAQDDFARWAKLRRQHDKAAENYEKTSSALQSQKSTFTTTASTIRFLGINGFRFLLQWWYARTPMFWIPAGWLPYYAEWILSFPRAPLGSVSVQVWGIACGSVMALIGEAVQAAWKLTISGGVASETQRKGQGEKMAFSAGVNGTGSGSDGSSTPGGVSDGLKKEL